MRFYYKGSFALLALGLATTTPNLVGRSQVDSAPLVPYSSPNPTSSQTLFSEIPSTHSGIDLVNSYNDPRMWGERYQEMVFGTIGTGVAVADYDKDGLPDLFLAAKTGGSRLYRNLGDFKFEDLTESAGLSLQDDSWSGRLRGLFGSGSDQDLPWDQGTAFVDVDNDGWLDLYVTSFNAPNRLYINQGDGTFHEEAEQRGLAIQDSSGSAAFCDFDRDGWLDVYLQTNMLDVISQPDGRPDRLFRNKGDGTFEEVTQSAGISGSTSGHSVAWWDYNEDGWPDIYVSNDFSVPDRLYQNNGDGTFTDVLESVLPLTPYYSMGADIGDINNDGLIDLFVGDMAPTSHETDHRGMAISRARELANRPPEAAPQRMRNALYLNTRSSRMLEAAWLFGVARSDWTWSVRFEDFDNDGWLDLHVTNGMIREYHNADILKGVMGAVSRQAQRAVMKRSPVMAESNLAFRNKQGQGFERVEQEWGLDHLGVSFGSATGDFDGDGDLDLIYANYDAPFTLYRNDSRDNRVVFALQGKQSNRYAIGASIEIQTVSGKQIRKHLNARGYLSTSEPIFHFGLGSEETIQTATIRWPSGNVQTLTNLKANRKYTVPEDNSSQNGTLATIPDPAPQLFRKADSTSLASNLQPPVQTKDSLAIAPPLVPQGIQFFPDFISVQADLNNDGTPDYVIGNLGLNTRYQASPEAPFVILEGRFANPRETQRIEAYVENGRLLPFRSRKDLIELIPPLERKFPSANAFAAATLEEILGPSAISKASRLEITELRSGALISSPEGELTFFPFTGLAQIAPITHVAIADFNGDGHLDIAAAQNEHDVDPVIGYHDGGLGVILLGDGTGHFNSLSPSESGLVLPGTNWRLNAQDVDKDGDIDLIATPSEGTSQIYLNRTND
ncbi:VCBS repeat-containing protein [Pelagicoccus sp. NFK12]|uniref:VCBS repeat-containing protein n=1 Tax=Pelagicoccus enzymogenes TaxID=2773457 RepID=A0A927F534_9BACT|nr:VCBS repeat-containing protein [Pelagicoccus enzymogenes]MBD5778327.1 VCBS repeat-containing protein [Pelagicoccus enzymogenes]